MNQVGDPVCSWLQLFAGVLGIMHFAARRKLTPCCARPAVTGQLGDGTTTDRLMPVKVVNVSAASMSATDVLGLGERHSCLVVNAGQIMCWGLNAEGQLGDGTTTNSLSPIAVAGISDATSVAAGHTHTCCSHATGQVSCWGGNLFGQLGDGSTRGSLRPVMVAGLSNVKMVSAGYLHTCAVRPGNQHSTAAPCAGVDARHNLSCMLTAALHVRWPVQVRFDGSVACFGDNHKGQLGLEVTESSDTQMATGPVTIPSLSGVHRLSAGHAHTCAVLNDGNARCAGSGGGCSRVLMVTER